MRATLRLLVLLMILGFVRSSSTNPPVPFQAMLTTFDLTGRIVNGTEAVLGQFFHQVSLMRSWNQKHFCGGSVISSHLVLTAGHCMYLSGNVIQPWTIIVVGGIVKLYDNGPTRQQKAVKSIRVHPKFDSINLYNDVAVLELSEPFTFTPELHKVRLPGNAPVPGTICYVSGWGYLSSSIPIVSPDLMYVDLPLRSLKECQSLYENKTKLIPGMFCAGYLEGGRDACQGDSGGGMICNGILTGIVSGGYGCAEPMLPGVYTNVYHYLDWILNDTAVVVVVNSCNVVNSRNLNNMGNYGTSNTSSIMVTIISFLFCAIFINYRP